MKNATLNNELNYYSLLLAFMEEVGVVSINTTSERVGIALEFFVSNPIVRGDATKVGDATVLLAVLSKAGVVTLMFSDNDKEELLKTLGFCVSVTEKHVDAFTLSMAAKA
jgi:hypothetical protein